MSVVGIEFEPVRGESVPPPRKGLGSYWRAVGGGSLMISLLIHAALLVGALFIVQTVTNEKPPVDFLPGGGSKSGQEASDQLAQQVQQKKRNPLDKKTPMQRVVSSSQSNIALPDIPMDLVDMPEMSSVMGGGAMGSGGFSSSGSGGGFGIGSGTGGAPGTTFKPIIMFGKNLQARRIGVVMDVSGSMTPHLTKVIKELDRVAKGSPVVLYVGCGVAVPTDNVKLDDDAISTVNRSKDEEKSFELFWRRSHKAAQPAGLPASPPPDSKKKKLEEEMAGPVPEEAVYGVMANRLETYFVKSQGIQYAWISLLVDELRNVDALYWFSDFQDQVDDKQLETVLRNLKRRKQKLFIHASDKGKSFEKVRDTLVIPSGGEVIEPEKEVKKNG